MAVNLFKINEEELRKQITWFEEIHDKAPEYLIMNNNTLDIIKITTHSYLYSNKNNDDYYGSYWGIPIAICNKLKDGMVEVV